MGPQSATAQSALYEEEQGCPLPDRALGVREARSPAPPPFPSVVAALPAQALTPEQTPLGAVPTMRGAAARQVTLDPSPNNWVPSCLFLGTHQSLNHTPLAPGCRPAILPVLPEPQPRDKATEQRATPSRRNLARGGPTLGSGPGLRHQLCLPPSAGPSRACHLTSWNHVYDRRVISHNNSEDENGDSYPRLSPYGWL